MAKAKKTYTSTYWVGGHSESAKKKLKSFGEEGKKKGHWKAYIVKRDTMTDFKGREGKITALFVHGRKTYPEGTKPSRLVGKPVSAFNDSAIELYKQSKKMK